ncbi:hypothetical protein F5Y16DRAFT_378365 [Xylariaceae sp. FL0255]|nr:hypothetical protein F5Y16DRAFT_378365 [Xylariaceae sp. FL0255]
MAWDEQLDDPDALFLKARDTFLLSVSASERQLYSKCSSSDELLKELESFAHLKNSHGRWSRCFKRIQKFTDHLTPYFEVMELFVSSHPEWAAIAWGALRLILQLAGNFTTHFEKFSCILQSLSEFLPGYAELALLAPEEYSPKLRHSVIRLYEDLFEFFKATANVFTQKDGKIKRTPVVISQLLWKPFHVRYKNFLDRLEFHRIVCRDEREQMITRLVLDEREKAEEARIREERHHEEVKKYLENIRRHNQNIQDDLARARATQEFTKIQAWVDPLSCSDQQNILEDSLRLCERDTTQWIFENDEFLRWARSRSENSSSVDRQSGNYLCVTGKPGSGKTVLAASTTVWLRNNLKELCAGECCIASYFFSYRSKRLHQAPAAYASILSQILNQHYDCMAIIEMFSFNHAARDSTDISASSKELMDLLAIAARKVSNLTLILDGLDECDSPDRVIEDITNAFLGSDAKLIVFSRPNVQFLISESGFRKILLGCDELQNDIQRYLARRVDDAIRRRVLPTTEDPSSIVNQLVVAADGMFIWARLMMDYINSPALTRHSRLVALRSVTRHETLEKMYSRILNLIMNKISPEREMAKRILAWIMRAARPLSTSQLMDVVQRYKEAAPERLDRVEPDHVIEIDLQCFREAAVVVCASLVEVAASNELRLIHQSVAEFLQNPPNENFEKDAAFDYFKCSKNEANELLATECFQYLHCRLPARPLSGDMKLRADAAIIRRSSPFLNYSLRFWAYHLQRSLPTRAALRPKIPCDQNSSRSLHIWNSILNDQSQVMAWLEAQYLLVAKPDIEILLTYFNQYLDRAGIDRDEDRQSSTSGGEVVGNSRLGRFHKFLIELDTDWSSTLSQNPHYIWGDITAFTQSEFLKTTRAVSVSSLASKSLGDPNFSSKPLMSISKESSCGSLLAVLSIWPTRSFEKLWTSASLSKLHQASYDNWQARYEIWSIKSDTPSKLRDFGILLDPMDVRAQVTGAMRQRAIAKPAQKAVLIWTLPFPAAIGDDLNIINILHAVYFMKQNSLQGPEHFELCKVQLKTEHDEHDCISAKNVEQHRAPTQCRVPCSYVISRGGKYVIRQDNKGPFVNVKNPPVHALVAYEVQSGIEVTMPTTNYWTPHPQISIRSFSLHPQLPLAIFSVHRPDDPGIDKIMLWDFSRRLEEEAFPGSAGARAVELTATMPQENLVRGLCGLQFSACGRQVIVSSSRRSGLQNPPVVISLEHYALYMRVASCCGRQPTTKTGDPSVHSTGSAQARESSNSLQTSRTSIKGGQLLVTTGDAASKTVSVTIQKEGRSIAILQSSSLHSSGAAVGDGERESQAILSLPESWNDTVSEEGIAIQRDDSRSSNSREKNIKIILNLVPQPYYTYDSDGAGEGHLPAVVVKDARALLPPTTKRQWSITDRNADESDIRYEKRLRGADWEDSYPT